MKFYNRTKEIADLQRIREMSYNDHSKLTVLTGRRRIGKTSLILNALKDETIVYLFVSRKSEADLCKGFCSEIEKRLSVFVPKMNSFIEIFRFLLEQGKAKKFSLVIDEFQEFININESIYSEIQNYWDQYRTTTHINFIVSGSVYSLMIKIFQDKKEPLFGRADAMMKLAPFTTSVLKEIMSDYKPDYTNDELLALYTYTGGVPKYVELLVDNKALTIHKMIKYICQSDSPFIDEGRNLLIQEFGKKYGNYFSILDAISSGMNTQSQIEAFMGEKSIGGQLNKLETIYEVIKKQRPLFAKEGSQTVRYEVSDNFLRFWFRYIERNRTLIELGNYEGLSKLINDDYPTYSGKTLELYFKQKLQESFEYRAIGSWWEPKGDQNEVDIVAITLDNKKALVAEVKRQKKNFKPQLLESKIEVLKNKVLSKYEINSLCLDIEDM
ncbi:ATP-binding protein [uncultured Bacteroides sp.]|uniref:ATP-binding protein n=1 Tax=uncultured Bacteroides sp. TaxID=162156 RepID=UPI002AA6EA76|nr:ATP-binding protein [uncultured Bacteroides sp.]